MSVVNLTQYKEPDVQGRLFDSKQEKTEPVETKNQSSESTGEKNRTDPKVCHDSKIKLEGITRLNTDQNKVNMENGEISGYNAYDSKRLDGILYPLIVINDRNVENPDIIYMKIDYDHFLPQINIKIYDEHQTEQNINTTQMGGIIRICMISAVDKVYKKILLNFRITNVYPDKNNPRYVTYFGEYNVDGFKQVNTSLIYMKDVCSSMPNCGQGGHIAANTWEMLHQIASLTGLGFAATKNCKEVKDHLVRHTHTQRYNKFIEQQLLHSGTDVDNILDAWVDLYGYIVMVNIPWIMNEDIKPDELTLTANVGLHGTSNDVMDEKPKTVNRTLTNYNNMGIRSNMEIESYTIEVDNKAVNTGTLERIYTYSFEDGKSNVKIETVETQTKQNSTDGTYLEDYNTGKSRPIPKFDFNSPAYTGIDTCVDINKQKRIREAYLKKLHQSVLYVKLTNINFGLQRGTLVNIIIFDNDPVNKDIMLKNTSRLLRTDDDAEEDKLNFPHEYPQHDITIDTEVYLPNGKLSGLYYIDGMSFEYSPEMGKIVQTIKLLKKGFTTGYLNKHTPIGVPISEHPGKPTLSETPIKNTENIV